MIKNCHILLLSCFFFSCQHKIDHQEEEQTNTIQTVVKDSTQVIADKAATIDVAVNQKKAIEYGGGDVYGVKTYSYNQDSTLLKMVNESSSGNYGFIKEKFYLNDGTLIYLERLIAQIEFGKEGDSSKYQISHERNYFLTQNKGLRLVQQKIAQHQYDTMFNGVESKKIPLTEKEYTQEKSLLIQIESYQLLDEN